MPKSKTSEALQFWRDVKDFMDASAYSLIALGLGLRKGEKGRKQALKPDSEWAASIQWWFEVGLLLNPVYQELDGPAKAMLVGWLLQALKDWISSLRK